MARIYMSLSLKGGRAPPEKLSKDRGKGLEPLGEAPAGKAWVSLDLGRFEASLMKAVSVSGFNPELVEFLNRFGTPFRQPWFVDIAKGDGTLTVAYVDLGGKIVACLPVVVSRRRRIFVRGDTASWTHINGPVIHPCLSGEEKAQAVSLLLNQLSRWISYKLVCEPENCDPALVEGFQTAGFKRRKQATYLRMPHDPNVLSKLHKKHRNNINRAARNFQITEDISAKEFMDFYLANLIAAGNVCYADPRLAMHLIEAGQTSKLQIGKEGEANRVIVFAAKTKNCETVAAIACLLSQDRMYYWLTTRKRFGEGDVVIKGSEDAIKVLLIHAGKKAEGLSLIFDADGVNTRSIGSLYERFFPHPAERGVFMRRAPHDPWVTERGTYGKNIYEWLDLVKERLRKKLFSKGTRLNQTQLACLLFCQEYMDFSSLFICIYA
jgi:hypothetical protein